jgi:hypothetical protein
VEWPPAEALLDEQRREPHLGVVPTECLFYGRELRLHLGDDGRARLKMYRKNVDRSALAVSRIGHFHGHIPASRRQHGDERADERGMPFVEQAVQGAAPPADVDAHSRVHGGEGATHAAQRDRVEVATLEARDRRLTDSRRARDGVLGQASPPAQSSQHGTRATVIHAPIMPFAAHLRPTGRSPAANRPLTRSSPRAVSLLAAVECQRLGAATAGLSSASHRQTRSRRWRRTGAVRKAYSCRRRPSRARSFGQRVRG